MRFSVFALATVPDTATTRRLFDLDDLDDKSVSKVLFHRRKQQTGSSERLRWDQRSIAAITTIQHAMGSVQIDSMNLARHSEEDMLHAFFKAVLRDGRLVSWDGERSDLPLVHFRTLKHQISYPAYWLARGGDVQPHLDLQSWLSPSDNDLPSLDETVRKLALPGMFQYSEDSVMDAWLRGQHEAVQAYSDLAALNAYLLALRMFKMTGEITPQDEVRVCKHLRSDLAARSLDHLDAFLAAWGND